MKSGEEAHYMKGLGSWNSRDLKSVVEKDGLDNMIKLLDLSNEALYNNWLKDTEVETRKELLNNHTFSIASL